MTHEVDTVNRAPGRHDDGAASLRHLLARVSICEARVRWMVSQRRARDPEPDDPVRGLYISEEDVDRLLAPPTPTASLDVTERLAELEAQADAAARAGADLRLRRLQDTFGLPELDIEVLLIALAPDLDQRFERLYGYLHDDVTRRRASVALALELMRISHTDWRGRARFLATSPLIATGLVRTEEDDRPLLTRSLRVPDRVTAHLLGDDTPFPRVAAAVVHVPPIRSDDGERVGAAILAGERLVHVRESARASGLAAGSAGLERAAWPPIVIDVRSIAASEIADVLAESRLEAGLRAAGLVLGPCDDMIEQERSILRALQGSPVPTVVVSSCAWPEESGETPATVMAEPLGNTQRQQLWDAVTAGADFDAASAMSAFRLRPEQVTRSWQLATLQARAANRAVTPDDLRAGARLQNSGRLDGLARHIPPQAALDDLVLQPQALGSVQEIVMRARHRDRVIDDWHMGGQSNSGRGITALFAGPSGTGKTLSAEVIAGELALDLYVIDLASVVDKYIGETEKNLERLFARAEDVNAVLFFDEADAIFGKRSEVSDAHDRYANLEIAYLLQRMERFDGITILATNLRANLDEAFTRRIDVMVDFPKPEESDRLRLWELHLPPQMPRDDGLHLDYLAKAFDLTGGDIRNVTLAAAYAAAADDRAVATEDLVRATAREYRKLGRLVTESEFGPYHDLVTISPAPVRDPGA